MPDVLAAVVKKLELTPLKKDRPDTNGEIRRPIHASKMSPANEGDKSIRRALDPDPPRRKSKSAWLRMLARFIAPFGDIHRLL